MWEQLYTPKVIAALTVLILAVNGALLYQLWNNPPEIQTADTPPSSESPQIPNTPTPDEEEAGDPNNEEGSEEESEDEAPAEEEAPAENESSAEDESEGREEIAQAPQGMDESRQEEQSPVGSPREGRNEPPDTPFESQYDPPPTSPGASTSGERPDAGGETEGGLARVQTVVLSAFYEVENDESVPPGSGTPGSGTPGSEVSILPATSGSGIFPVFVVVAVVVGAAAVVVFRRR